MCGICGSYDFAHGRPADRTLLERMNAALTHRGPDGDGCHIDGALGLAARRLAIIDPEHGEQPMLAADGAVCVVQNGEILNHRKLPAGHLLACGTSGATLSRYARPAPAAGSELRREGAQVLAQELRERLRDSVKAHLLADVPVGVLLSGGVDSSVLTALASQAS